MGEEIIQAFRDLWTTVLVRSPAIVCGTLVLAIFILLGTYLRKVTRRRLLDRVEDKLLVNFAARMVFLLMLTIGVVVFLNQLGLGKIAGGLLAGAGVSAIIIGLAFKDIGENFLAGIFLAFSRPFSIGDVIEVQGIMGVVKELSFRNTHIRTFEGKDVFLPNGMLIKHPLSNYTRDGLLRYDFVVGLDYGSDLSRAIQLIMQYLKSEQRVEQSDDNAPFLMMEELAASTVNIRVFYWVNSFNFTGDIAALRTDIMNNILLRLTENGFRLPAPIVEVKSYGDAQMFPVRIDGK
jgi:small-conductance mechanosensitive channel